MQSALQLRLRIEGWMVRIGTAGWVIPRQSAEMAAGEGSHLERYALVLGRVQIIWSFHRAHRPATWARWAEAVLEGFRFSVKFSEDGDAE